MRSLGPGVRAPLPTLREGGPWYLNGAHNPDLSRVHAGSRHHLWGVAQLAARLALDQEVAGSTPASPASNTQADVVELVDTPGRGPGAPRALRVRPPPSALFQRRVAQFGRAPGLHPERREFNSLLADTIFQQHTRWSPNGKAPALPSSYMGVQLSSAALSNPWLGSRSGSGGGPQNRPYVGSNPTRASMWM